VKGERLHSLANEFSGEFATRLFGFVPFRSLTHSTAVLGTT